MPASNIRFQCQQAAVPARTVGPDTAYGKEGGIAMREGKIPTRYRGYQVSTIKFWELPQIAQLERQVFAEPMPLAEVIHKYRQPNTHYLVVKDRRRIIAYFGFEIIKPYAHVLANVTHPSYRRQGLATFVLTAAEPWARDEEARAFLGEVRVSNQPQLTVLQNIGWIRVALVPQGFGNGEDAHIVMKIFD